MQTSPFTMLNFLVIGLGAALGAWSRWGLSLWLNTGPDKFPVGTLVANFAGSYMIGLAIAWSLIHPDWSSHVRLLIVTGLLGALTTFSTFSAETVTFLHQGRYSLAAVYASVSLFGCLLMTSLGWLTLSGLKH